MKNFIFAMCGFLMMSLVSLSVQASSVESPKCEYVNPSVNAGLPDIQSITLETAPADCVQGIRINVPKCPFRYIYKSKYCTHYSYTAYSKLITPY